MTTLQEAAMRQSFETWAKPILGDNPTWKESGECELAWQSWKAALAQGGTLIDEGTKLTPHPSQDVPAISFGNMPHGWTHDGSNRLMSEDDAKQEAKQCGGTTRAYPLYALPQRELTDEHIAAANMCRKAGRVSVSMVQRKMNTGYQEAQVLVAEIVAAGLVDGIEASGLPNI